MDATAVLQQLMEESPNTVEIELREDVVENAVELLRDPKQFNSVNTPMPLRRRKDLADKLERSLPNNPDAVAFAGLPGAGKSYASDKLGTVYDAPVISMGDAIREKYKNENWMGRPKSDVPDEIPSDKLGDFAAEWRSNDAEGIPKKVTQIVDRWDEDLIVIDGVRSPTDYEVLSTFFDNFHLIEIKTPFYERLDRLHDRGREGEDGFTAIDLAERDDRELYELGLYYTRKKDYIDLEILTGKRKPGFAISLSKIVENNLPYRIEDGTPLGSIGKVEELRERQQQDAV
jgi:dephospho-CoA kinase